MNPLRQPTVTSELDLHYQGHAPDTYFPATDISAHFTDVGSSETDNTRGDLELLMHDDLLIAFSEHAEQLEYLAMNLPTHKLFEVYEEALYSSNPGSVFASYAEQIQDNPSLFETSLGNRAGPVEIDLSNPSAALLYVDYDPEA